MASPCIRFGCGCSGNRGVHGERPINGDEPCSRPPPYSVISHMGRFCGVERRHVRILSRDRLIMNSGDFRAPLANGHGSGGSTTGPTRSPVGQPHIHRRWYSGSGPLYPTGRYRSGRTLPPLVNDQSRRWSGGARRAHRRRPANRPDAVSVAIRRPRSGGRSRWSRRNRVIQRRYGWRNTRGNGRAGNPPRRRPGIDRRCHLAHHTRSTGALGACRYWRQVTLAWLSAGRSAALPRGSGGERPREEYVKAFARSTARNRAVIRAMSPKFYYRRRPGWVRPRRRTSRRLLVGSSR